MREFLKKFFYENRYIFYMFLAASIYIAALHFIFGITPALLEITAVFFASIQFDLFRRERPAAFIFNIINCILLIFWFSSIGLYGQVTLRSIFVCLNLVGLYLWLRPENGTKKTIQPSFLPRKISTVFYIIFAAFFVIIYFTRGLIPSMDWTYMLCAAVGNILIAKKKTDAWVIWLITDLIGIPLFFLIGSWMYLLVSVFMLGVEIMALKEWGRKNE